MDNRLLERLYEYLATNAYGKENGKSLKEIAQEFLSNGNKRTMRKLLSALNSATDMNGIVSTSGKIYLCATKDECEKAIKTTYRLAISCIKKARKMERKLGLQNQIELDDNGTKIRVVFENE